MLSSEIYHCPGNKGPYTVEAFFFCKGEVKIYLVLLYFTGGVLVSSWRQDLPLAKRLQFALSQFLWCGLKWNLQHLQDMFTFAQLSLWTLDPGSVTVLVSYRRCNKLPQTSWLKTTQAYHLQFWTSDIRNGSHWPKTKVSAGPCLLRGQGNSLLCPAHRGFPAAVVLACPFIFRASNNWETLSQITSPWCSLPHLRPS